MRFLKPVLLTLQVNVRMLAILSPNIFIQEWIRKKEISDLISNQFEILEKTDNKLFALYKKGEGYLGNRRNFYIELFFSKEGKLLKNKSYLDKSNNI